MRWLICLFFVCYTSHSWSQITYFKDIAPIIKNNCQNCHRNGDIGPMPFTSYKEVASYASMIKFVTDAKLMPPFKADIHKVTYANERALSEQEKETIAEWITNGLNKGDSIAALPPIQIANNKYDYTICMSEPFEHYGIYYDQYQVFVLSLDMIEGKFVKDVFFDPGNGEIVRSANISIAKKGASLAMNSWDPRYGYFAYGNLGFKPALPNWFSWMPHTPELELLKDESLYIPSDSELLLHIHYGPYGEIQKDSSCIHFNFENAPNTLLQNVPLISSEFLTDTFLLEADLKKRVTSSFILPIATKIRSITPLAHLLCRSWEVFAVLPDRSSLTLLSINDWDFHWKEKYVFENRIELPEGTKIYATATYDNTIENPYNPSNPPHSMKVGPHMYDENYECYFEFVSPSSQNGYILKPFTLLEEIHSDVSFVITTSGNYELQLYTMNTGTNKVLSSKYYNVGKHSLISSDFPSQKGRYCIILKSADDVEDVWWFVVY